MASPTVAANAYASLAKIMEQPGAGKAVETGGPSFSALLKDAVGSVLDAGKKSDAQSVAMASGKANVMDVVTAGGDRRRGLDAGIGARPRHPVLRRHHADADLI